MIFIYCSQSDIRKKFRDQLKDLAQLLLSPQNLVVKKINNIPLTGHSLFEYFKVLRSKSKINKKAERVCVLLSSYYMPCANTLEKCSGQINLMLLRFACPVPKNLKCAYAVEDKIDEH